MATIETVRSIRTIDFDQRVVMDDLDWGGYTAILRLRGGRGGPRLVYLDGSLTFVSPSYTHEWLKTRFGTFVTEVVQGLRIPCKPAGSLTFRRRAKRGGVEGDQTYYLASEPRVRGKKIDPRVDPSPDLAIEVVHAHDAAAAVEVYRRLGVPEVWVCGELGLKILARREDGHFAKVQTSVAFPFMTAAEIFAWVGRPERDDAGETDWGLEVRDWVRTTLAPRVRDERAEENP